MKHDESRRLTEQMLELYNAGASFSAIATVFSVTRQAVHYRLNDLVPKTGRNKKIREEKIRRKQYGKRPFITFNGVQYYEDKNGYHSCILSGECLQLHRSIWESVNGPIPKGFHIHHRNQDTHDNRLENLELLTISEHSKRHAKTDPEIFRKMGQSRSPKKLAAVARAGQALKKIRQARGWKTKP